ncbi:MAG: ABC transporter permease [Candidatus Eisenbacteria bacterium]|uniref:ABC transporter permease n=1 Tax=Eiseniibacteriota bacterium TaxID=2212470 RepID=A0A538TA13_UNCEI|nr:MAG: ABC transporter permease [Candidatus Eisenbacteria bacterium]
MSRVVAIARNTLREVMRERVVLILALFGLALVIGSQALSPLALGEGRKVVIDFGLAGSTLLATLLTVFLGSSLLHKELERRTVYAILAKPIRREEFLVGKFLGLWFTTSMLLASMAGILAAVVTVAYGSTPWTVFGAVGLSVMELSIVTAVVVLFSSFTTPALTAFFAVAALVAGHFAEDLRYFVSQGAPAGIQALAQAVYWMLPHLGVFNARGLVVHGIAVEPERLAFAFAYGLLYASGVMIVAATIFRRREFR